MSTKRYLYRDTENQKIFGVAKGLADYLDIDATVVRVIWIILIFATAGTAILVYIIMALVIDPKDVVMAKAYQEEKKKTVVDSDDPFAKYDK